jgi:hypothetical protein
MNWIETLAAASTLRPTNCCIRSKIIAQAFSVKALHDCTEPTRRTTYPTAIARNWRPVLAQLSLFAVPERATSLIFKDFDLKGLHYGV